MMPDDRMNQQGQITPEVQQALDAMRADLEARRASSDQEVLQEQEQEWEDNNFPFPRVAKAATSVANGVLKAGFETKDFLFGETPEADKSETRREVEALDRALDKESIGYGLTSGVSQMVTGLIGAGKLMAPLKGVKGLKAVGTAGKIGHETVKGALASAVVLDPHEERLSNLIEEFPDLQNPVTDYLAADPEDSAAEGRFKNALESIGLDFALVGAVKAIKYLRAGDAEKAAREIAKLEKAQEANRKEFGLDFGEGERAGIEKDLTADAGPAQGNRDAFGLDFGPERVKEPQEGPAGTRTAPPAAGKAITPANSETPLSAAPGVKEADQAGGAGPDLPSSNPDGQPKAISDSTTPIEVSPEDVSKILQATDANLKAIAQFGSREAAAEAGQMASRSASRLPWQKLYAPDGLSAFMDNAEQTLKAQMDAAKGGDVLSDPAVNAKVRDMASYWGEDPATLMGELARAGEDASAMTARMEAAYLISNRMLDETYEAAFKVHNGMLEDWGGDAAKAGEELRARLRASSALLASAQSIRSNTGRTMRRLRGQLRLRPEDLEAIDGMDTARLADLLYATKGDPKKLAQAANPTFLRRVLNEANFSLTNSLLWLYRTHVFNIASNLYMLAGRPTEKLLGAVAMGPKDSGGVLRRQALREYGATVAALEDAWEAMAEAFKRGDSILSPHNTEFFQGSITQQPLPWRPVKNITDLAHNAWMAANYRTIVGLPTRTLGAVDEFFKTLRYRAYVQARAAVEANARGLSGANFKRYLEEAMEKAIDPATGQARDRKALMEAQTTTFQNELLAGTAGATIQQARNRHPILTLILPFVKTPVNVLRYGWKMTPGLNLLQKEFREALSGGQGAEAQAHAIGQMTLGSVFMGLAATLAINGKITGAGPKDPKLQRELKATGWRPYSYVFEDDQGGKRYVPMGRLDPAGMTFSMVADLVETMRLDPESSGVEVGMGALLLGLAKNFTDRTFLQNMHHALEALSDPGSRGERWLGNIAGNTIPLSSALRGINPDPYLREARGFIDTMLKNLPGYSETLPPVRDAFGEPVWRHIGITTKDEADEVEAEHNRMVLETGKGLGKPSPRFEGLDLRDITLSNGRNAYDRLQELSGQLPSGPSLKEALAKLIRSETYQNMPDGESAITGTRLNALGRIVSKYRETARKVLLREAPELRKLVGSRQREAARAYHENRKRGAEPGARELLEALQGGQGL